MELDELWNEVRKEKHKQKKNAVTQVESTEPPRTLYTDPANWTRTRGVALIHAESETLLGNFSEYVHRSVAGCRRLVRESEPISVEATESISGYWTSRTGQQPLMREAWHEKRNATLYLELDALGVQAADCRLVVHLSHGGIARVELAEAARLCGIAGEQLLFLPAGVNVLDTMSYACKVALRKELGL